MANDLLLYSDDEKDNGLPPEEDEGDEMSNLDDDNLDDDILEGDDELE